MSYSQHITASPYHVTACDQVIEIQAKYLTDLTDFSKKADAFFTFSLYMINQFAQRDVNTIMNSISMYKLKTTPSIITGSVSCVSFAASSNNITICLPDKDTANQIIEAFNQFMKCRIGDNLKSTPAATVQRILKAGCKFFNLTYRSRT